MPSYESLADLRLDDLIALGPDDSLAHHGIKGQKWGIRRYQNPDGTLTQAGQEHYRNTYNKSEKRREKLQNKLNKYPAKIDKARHRADKIAPGFVIRLLLGERGRRRVATWRATREYKVSKLKNQEYKTKKHLDRLEKRMKRRYRDIPLEELVDIDVSWLRD